MTHARANTRVHTEGERERGLPNGKEMNFLMLIIMVYTSKLNDTFYPKDFHFLCVQSSPLRFKCMHHP
jgi:hypothetical protein